MKVKSESEGSQSCPTVSDPMDCSWPGSSGIFQARYWSGVPLPSPNKILLSLKKKKKKNEILPLPVTWIELKGIMLSEIRQWKINTIQYHFYV